MNPIAKNLLSLFARPLGAAINNALAAGSAAVVLWSAKQGFDGGIVTPIVGAAVNLISVTIAGLAATQGVQIPIINADARNGVTVVSSRAAENAGIPKANAPLPKA